MSARHPLRRIRASAGSGKTYALTADVLGLLAEAGPAPRTSYAACRLSPNTEANLAPRAHATDWSEVLAVTFTNRAAAEMRDRVLARLKDMALGQSAPERGWTQSSAAGAVESLLRDFSALNMRTIDSLIHLVVRMAALDLGLPPDFEPVFDEKSLFAPLVDQLAELARNAPPEADNTLASFPNPAAMANSGLQSRASSAPGEDHTNDPAEAARIAGMFRAACRHALLHGGHKGFLAGDKVRDNISTLASFLLHNPDKANSPLATSDASVFRLQAMEERLRTLAGQMQECLTEENLAAHQNFRNALERCVNQTEKLPIASVYLSKDDLNACLNKGSAKQKGRGQASELAQGLYLRLAEAQHSMAEEGVILRRALAYMPYTELARRVLEALPDHLFQSGQFPANLAPRWARTVLDSRYGVSEAFCRMGTRISHILVDEFQDTSVEQWLALKPLAVEALSRRGSLSIVGDVKQAVYGWRGGEAALFELAPEDQDIQCIVPHVDEHSLDHNWRSRRAIVEWNNAVFSQLEDEGTARQVLEFLLPSRQKNEDDSSAMQAMEEGTGMLVSAFRDAAQKVAPGKEGGLVRLTFLPPPPPRQKNMLEAPADPESADQTADDSESLQYLLVERVRELGQRRPWGDMCVLTRTNEETALAATWLLGGGIPVVTQGSLLLAEQPLVAQSAALLAFLNNPEDDSLFWAVLLGHDLLPPLPDLCKLPLPGTGTTAAPLPSDGPGSGPDTGPTIDMVSEMTNEMTSENGSIQGAEHTGHIWHHWAAHRVSGRARPEGSLARDFRSAFPTVWNDIFAPLHDAAGLLTPYDTVCEIFDRWRVWERHPESTGFLLRFLEVLHGAERKGLNDLSGFLEYWAAHGHEEKAPLPESMNAVSIMTIHKAKGLQFEVVLTPWHDFPIKAGKAPTLYECADGLHVVAPLNTAMKEAYGQALSDSAREAINLLYVAWTRPVCELHCFLPSPEKGHMSKVIDLLTAPLLENASLLPCGDKVLPGIPDLDSPPDMEKNTLHAPSASAPALAPCPASPAFALQNDDASQKNGPATGNATGPATGDTIEDTTGNANGDAVAESTWSPMAWLPRLKIFRSPLDGWALDAARRGTLIHACLERLRITGSPASDAAVAVRHGLDAFPLPVPDRDQVEQDLAKPLAWYAALPQAGHWLAFGTPEHTLLDADAKAHRVDLLVDDGQEMLAVEYKTGSTGPLPAPAHVEQLQGYLALLSQASDMPCRGVLVYLDRQEIFPLSPSSGPAQPKVTTPANAPANAPGAAHSCPF